MSDLPIRPPYRLHVNLPALKRMILTAVVIVTVSGSISNLLIYQFIRDPDSSFTKLLYRFDLGHEPSFPAFFSSLLILFSSFLCFVAGVLTPRAQRSTFAWVFLGCVMIALSVDETIMLHETLDAAFRNYGILNIWFLMPWTIAGLAFVVVVAATTRRIFVNLSRTASRYIVAGGIIFVTGAIGVENVAGYIFAMEGSEEAGIQTLAHWASQTVEEFMEMLGMSLFAFGVIDHIAGLNPEFAVHLKNEGNLTDAE